MAFDIEDEETEALVARLAAKLGVSAEEAVLIAVRLALRKDEEVQARTSSTPISAASD